MFEEWLNNLDDDFITVENMTMGVHIVSFRQHIRGKDGMTFSVNDGSDKFYVGYM